FFENNHMMIICTTSERLSEWIKCEHFQIDLSFKRVAGEINEFEVNYYNPQHNLTPQFKHTHKKGWGCVIADLDYAQAQDLGLVLNEIDKTRNWEEYLVHFFKSCKVHYKAESEDTINHLFDNIQKIDKNTAVNSDTENDDKENKLTSRISELEYKERVLALKEHEIDLREREAKIYLMELSNFEKKRELEFVKS
ncbi:6159_t:CDS:2, partial [Funneliformis geosporum]